MKITFYYTDGTSETHTGTSDELQPLLQEFNKHPKFLTWKHGNKTLEWTKEKGWHKNVDKPWRIYWLSGATEVLHGKNIQDAFSKHYAGSALMAVDWYDQTDAITHTWDTEKKEWVPNEPVSEAA